jgi:hypothetical protein
MRSAWVMFLLAGLCCSVYAHAQNERGTILGTVTDSTGAVVSHAKVKVTNADTGIVTSMATNNEGLYLAPNLIPGHYSVTVEQPGFRKFVASDLVLLVDQKLRVDGHLAPGDVNAEVTVTSTTQMVNTDSNTFGQVVENRQVVDLPLVSRNFQQLAVLSPATVVFSSGWGGEQANQNPLTTSLNIGGARGASNVYTLDGVDNNDPSFQIPTITPSIDAIQEFKLLNKGYSAEYGGGSGQVNIAIKSGTNSLHGTAYDFFRNDVLNDKDYFASPDPLTGRIKPQLRYNQFGFSLGGPVVIPHVVNGHNKLFFFTNYEGTRIHQYQSQRGQFPTPAELSGDFSADSAIYDPQTGLPFPGNVIPSNRISAKSQQVIGFNLFATPNVPNGGGFNAVSYQLKPTDQNQFNARSDAKLGEKDLIFGRYSWSHLDDLFPSLAPLQRTDRHVSGHSIGLGLIHMFSPTLLNEMRFGYNRPNYTKQQEGAFGKDIAGALFQGTDPKPADFGPPLFVFSGYNVIGSGDGPLTWITNSYSFVDTLSWVKGKHNLKMGVDLRRARYYENYTLFRSRGLLVFDGHYTSGASNPSGNGLADFMLGFPNFVLVGEGQTGIHMRFQQYHGFVQDDWKVLPRLTVNFGMRYEYRTPLVEDKDRIAMFDGSVPGGRVLTPNRDIVTQLNTPFIAFTPDKGMIPPDRNNFAPRFGFALRPFNNNSTVVNGGYGVVYEQWELNDNIFDVFGPPWQQSYAAVSGAQPIDYANLFPTAAVPAPGTAAVYSMGIKNRTPYTHEWNLAVEHELKGNWLVQLGYLGSASHKLSARNTLTQGILHPDGTVTPSPWYNFGFLVVTTTDSSANYNGGTAKIEKRFSNGYSLLAHYTYSRALGYISATCGTGNDGCTSRQNYWDVRAEYGPAAYDFTHRFVASSIYELPFGKGKFLGGNAGGLVDKLIGGWQVGGIYQIQSGEPFSVRANDASGTGGGDIRRADLVGDPYAVDKLDPRWNDPRRAFNRLAFAQPTPGHFGNSGRNMVRGAKMNNLDFSLIKNTTLTESTKLQFRVEAFNALNHTQFGPIPGTQVSSDLVNSGYGLYNSTQVPSRIVQLAMKVIF